MCFLENFIFGHLLGRLFVRAIDERRCFRRACVELVGADNDFDGVYSSPLGRAVALARGLGSVAAALWQRGRVWIVAPN